MKVWKKAVSAALCICLVVSLFTGFSLTDVPLRALPKRH